MVEEQTPVDSQSTSSLPHEFLQRMQDLLGDEFPAFLKIHAKPAKTGLRVNTLKIKVNDYQYLSPFNLTPVSWCPTGFIAPSSTQPGKHPHHAAGLYYLQEPSAMAAAEILAPQPGECVLDISAAPGGKTTHLAALMKNQGVLVANEIHPRRAWDLAQNIERCGIRIATITNETPEKLAAHFGPFFDRVLLDAPCSGEGMFRKSETARTHWNTSLVRGCALRQKAILSDAARLVKPGGWLVFSTCTFAPEENEEVIIHFLKEHPDFVIDPPPARPGYSPGKRLPTDTDQYPLENTIRIWPHLSAGEGHFIARLQRVHKPVPSKPSIHPRAVSPHLPSSLRVLFQEFLDTTLKEFTTGNRLCLRGSYLYQVPDGLPDVDGLQVIHPGWWLGMFRKNRFIPSHALAMAIATNQALQRYDCISTQPEILSYLRGEVLIAPGEDGWILITLDDFSIGWGKRVQGRIKNAYPHGLRWN